jgi:hypothetical protein
VLWLLLYFLPVSHFCFSYWAGHSQLSFLSPTQRQMACLALRQTWTDTSPIFPPWLLKSTDRRRGVLNMKTHRWV